MSVDDDLGEEGADTPPTTHSRGRVLSVDSDWPRRLASIPWMRACGDPNLVWDGEASVAAGPAEAIASIASLEWENFTLDRQGDLTIRLHADHMDAYSSWNRFAAWTKAAVLTPIREVVETAAVESDMGAEIVPTILWDLLHIVMADVYRPLLPRAHRFDLLPVYEQGHIPCGWMGEYPSGTLIYW